MPKSGLRTEPEPEPEPQRERKQVRRQLQDPARVRNRPESTPHPNPPAKDFGNDWTPEPPHSSHPPKPDPEAAAAGGGEGPRGLQDGAPGANLPDSRSSRQQVIR